jgi:pilus assembly protein CpaB
MRLLLLLVAAIVAIFAGLAALQISKPAPAPEASAPAATSVNTVDILVARAPIAVGTMVTQAMIDMQPWPENLVLKGFIVSGSEEANIVGKVTRSQLQEREPFLANKLASATEPGFLAARLPSGMRAVTIATDAVSGLAGFVYPGDRVDVILTHNIPFQVSGPSRPGEARPLSDKPAFSEVIVSNVQVLAVNLRDAANKEDERYSAIISPSSMTLQINSDDAAKIRLAEKAGTISVALRSLADINDSTIEKSANLKGITNVDMTTEQEDNSVKVTRK